MFKIIYIPADDDSRTRQFNLVKSKFFINSDIIDKYLKSKLLKFKTRPNFKHSTEESNDPFFKPFIRMLKKEDVGTKTGTEIRWEKKKKITEELFQHFSNLAFDETVRGDNEKWKYVEFHYMIFKNQYDEVFCSKCIRNYKALLNNKVEWFGSNEAGLLIQCPKGHNLHWVLTTVF